VYQSQNELYIGFYGPREGSWSRDPPQRGEILEGDFTKFSASKKQNSKKLLSSIF
jgi:hypothetical protein